MALMGPSGFKKIEVDKIFYFIYPNWFVENLNNEYITYQLSWLF